MFLDYKLELVGQDNRIGICCVCGEELTSVDTIIKYENDLYCNSDCLATSIQGFETELTENVRCDFCNRILEVGDEVITDLDGSIYCDFICFYNNHEIKEVIGYDLH